MSGSDSLERRLARLEVVYQAPKRCPECHNRPVRTVRIDEATDAMLSESMPARDCPACERAVYRELRLVGPREGMDAR